MLRSAKQRWLVTALLLPACTALDSAPEAGQVRSELRRENGDALNGVRMNGSALNGVALNGVRMNGSALGGLTLEATVLAGTRGDGTAVAPEALIGAELGGTLADGSTVALRIDDVGHAPAPNEDLYVYLVSYAAGAEPQAADGWHHLCGDDAAGQPIAAMPLGGVWNDQRGVPGGGAWTAMPGWITFACRGAALAKCVEMGYRPWQNLRSCSGGSCSDVSGADVHQACTRMVRADYCGVGEPYTVNGRAINVYDSLGVQADTESWTFEAEWTPQGASCLSQQRVYQLQAQLDETSHTTLPPCITSRVAVGCGSLAHFSSGTLLMNEFETTYVKVGVTP
jgi:ADYC domain